MSIKLKNNELLDLILNDLKNLKNDVKDIKRDVSIIRKDIFIKKAIEEPKEENQDNIIVASNSWFF